MLPRDGCLDSKVLHYLAGSGRLKRALLVDGTRGFVGDIIEVAS